MARIRQPRPDSGLGFQIKVPKPSKLFPLRSEAVAQEETGLGQGPRQSAGRGSSIFQGAIARRFIFGGIQGALNFLKSGHFVPFPLDGPTRFQERELFTDILLA